MNQISTSSSETKPPLASTLSYSAGSSNASNEVIETTNELSTLQCKPYLQMQQQQEQQLRQLHPAHHFGFANIPQLRQNSWMEVDGYRDVGLEVGSNATISYGEIFSTAISIIFRAITVCINVKLAVNYYNQGHQDYFIWTVICIVTPMFITILIHANMCYQDGKFNGGFCKILQTLCLVLISSFLFRYWNSLLYAIKCKRAEIMGDKEEKLKNYKLNIREESDVAFIRLFECFLEAAPQKILQISIVLAHIDKMTNLQIIAITSYFGSMAWCLSVYHRYNRYSQSDKYNISTNGVILQLCWHFCISVSRTLCIAFVASIFPLWLLIACLVHALLFGFVTFIVDRPKFARNSFCNFLFCLVLGVVYIFTYISVRDAPTRYKYLIYYIFCSLENIICVLLFIFYANNDLRSLAILFYPLCAMALAFYYVGILFMVIYYLYFHPRITARNSKRIINNN
ncbi:XK-related protein 4 [Calliphora vicina]|uniref:XK-related protein 4 n=1 Tax=Calliphora vicina TaxID=7373 RepID=UPI00325BBCB3